MRIFAVILGAAAVAAGVILFLNFTVKEPVSEVAGPDLAARARIDSLEQALHEVSLGVERLKEDVESLHAKFAALPGTAREAPVKNPNPPPAPEETPPDRSTAGLPDEQGSLREIIRKEIVSLEEERKKKQEEERKARQPEEWEREEFGNYAWQIHRTGNKLGLTDSQKRQYYEIIKEHSQRTRSLWKDIREKNPGAKWEEISKEYQQRSNEMVKTTRDMVANSLNAKQKKKYAELCEQSEWFK